MTGNVVADSGYYRRNDGTAIETCLKRVGGDWARLPTAKLQRREIAAFVELHVEQGGVLESTGDRIGVVKGIVGQYRFAVTVTGRMNHAGTTPMNMRKDALVAASQIVLAVNQLGNTPGEQVATVGYFTVSPNAVNVFPGKVELKIDLRDLSQTHLDNLVAQMRQQFAEIATATQTEIVMTQALHVMPTLYQFNVKINLIQH